MRKIAANYIFLPGYPLVRNGYVVIDGQNVVDVVNTGGFIREIPGLEFYGGMIVAGFLMSDKRDWCPGMICYRVLSICMIKDVIGELDWLLCKELIGSTSDGQRRLLFYVWYNTKIKNDE